VTGDGLIDMIRTIALNEIGGDAAAQEWLDTNFNYPLVVGLLAAAMKKKWGVTDEWMKERFVFGDTPVEQVVLDLEEFTGEEGLAAAVGELANDLASNIAKRRSESLGQ
jgi:hypothetical protein